MPRAGGPWIGQLGLRLALAFVGVALAAVTFSVVIGSVTTSRDIDQLIMQQQVDLTRAIAGAAGKAYDHVGWAHADLAVMTDLVTHAGARVQVTDVTGQVIDSSPHFARYRGRPERTKPVIMHGQQVGSVEVRFDNSGLSAAIEQFQAERWSARISAAGAAAVFALLVALLVSRRITAPVDRLIDAARARGRGERGARAHEVRGLGEIKELAEAYDQMADAIQEQDRVRRNLVADVAHELRTPIAVLQAGHEAMLDGLAMPTTEHLVSLHDEVLRLARMVDDLQRLASAEAAALQLTLVPRDLAAIVELAADSLADSFSAAGIVLRRQLTEVRVLCDPLRMHEIALNLLTNAMKFTPGGGSVLLEAGPDQVPGSELAVLRVSDTGVGIPPDELPLVTERFFRGQRSLGIAGSGIGLTIVTELVRAHHGSLAIMSEPGFGTEVTVRLPVPADAAEPERQAARSAEVARQAPAEHP